jgi:hypothetical protein
MSEILQNVLLAFGNQKLLDLVQSDVFGTFALITLKPYVDLNFLETPTLLERYLDMSLRTHYAFWGIIVKT